MYLIFISKALFWPSLEVLYKFISFTRYLCSTPFKVSTQRCSLRGPMWC